MIKKRREVLASYILIASNSWRRMYPETFYKPNAFVSAQELRYVGLIYNIFQKATDSHGRTLIEDEINLIYMEIESNINSSPGKFPEVILSAIQRRLDLKKQTIQEIEALATEAESLLSNFGQNPPHIQGGGAPLNPFYSSFFPKSLRFRLESTTYLVRLLAYGLFSNNNMVSDRVAEVFDVAELQSATEPKDKQSMDDALKFLYKGLIQKNEHGRQGSRHAARQTIALLREWYHDNEYVISCIDKMSKYV